MKLTLTLEHNGRTATRILHSDGSIAPFDIGDAFKYARKECESKSPGQTLYESIHAVKDPWWEKISQADRDQWDRRAHVFLCIMKENGYK